MIFSLSLFSGLSLNKILVPVFYFVSILMFCWGFVWVSFLCSYLFDLLGVAESLVDFSHSRYWSILFKSEWCFSNSVNLRVTFKFIFWVSFYNTWLLSLPSEDFLCIWESLWAKLIYFYILLRYKSVRNKLNNISRFFTFSHIIGLI